MRQARDEAIWEGSEPLTVLWYYRYMTPAFIKTERKTEELHPNPINPRTLKEKAFKELQKSLKDDPHFFQARPLIVSMAEGRENTIIAGNQRLEAAKALGWATVPVIEVRGATLEEEKQWMVKDNLHKGEWDFEKLADGFDLDFLNFLSTYSHIVHLHS